jgi:flagellar protein FliO/FliZ
VTAYFTEMAGPTFGPLLGLGVILILIAAGLWILLMVVRRFRSGLFVSGGNKGRMPRLAVTDAVPVDSSRRLILVRRDDVEHLIMIGGPTDIVVEAGIGKPQPVVSQQPAPRMPMQTTQPQVAPQPAPRPAIQAARDAVADAERGRPVRVPEAQLPERRTEPVSPPPVAPPAPPAVSPPVAPPPPAPPPPVVAAPAVQASSRPELDLDKLLDELRPNPLQDR